MSVPTEIVAGKTTYVHIAEKSHDYYAPQELMPSPPHASQWRYCVAKQQGNTVYFSNRATSESVWVLPDLHPDKPGEAVVMVTRGSTDSATKRLQQQPAASSAATPTVTAAIMPTKPTFSAVQASIAAETATTPAPAVVESTAAPPTTTNADDVKKSIQEKLQETIRQRLAARGIAPGSTTPNVAAAPAPSVFSSSSTTAAVAASLQMPPAATTSSLSVAQPAEASPRTPVDLGQSTGAETPTSKFVGGSPGGGVRDRIAAWRAGKGGAAGGGNSAGRSRSLTPQASVAGDDRDNASLTPVQESPIRNANVALGSDDGSGAGIDASPTDAAGTNAAASNRGGVGAAALFRRPRPTRQTSVPTSESMAASDSAGGVGAVASSHSEVRSISNDIYEEKRQQMLLADEQLQKEKAELLRAERAAVERAKLAAEMRVKEEENYIRILNERRRLEEERLAIERRERETLLSLLAQPAIVKIKEDAATVVNQYALAAEEAQKREEAAKLRAKSFSEAIAQSLMDAVQPKHHHHATGVVAAVPPASDDDDDDDDSKVGKDRNLVAANSTVATIQYTPQLRYVGHIGGGSAANASSIIKAKHIGGGGGDSSLVNNSNSAVTKKRPAGSNNNNTQHSLMLESREGPGTYYYDAQGTVRYDGKWKHDKKHGKGDFSSPNTVYEGSWRQDKPHGKGMLQTRNMKASLETQNGHAKGNMIAQLANGSTFVGVVDQDAVASPGAISFASGDHVEWKWVDPKAHGGGTGDCRIQFHSGDSYVGSVQNYALHGRGAFLSADGHEYIGEFANGFMEGVGFFRFKNGNTYEGRLMKSLFHGHGVYQSIDGEYVYDGEWKQGMMHGEGTVTYANGDVWRGAFEEDHRRAGKYVASALFQLP